MWTLKPPIKFESCKLKSVKTFFLCGVTACHGLALGLEDRDTRDEKQDQARLLRASLSFKKIKVLTL